MEALVVYLRVIWRVSSSSTYSSRAGPTRANSSRLAVHADGLQVRLLASSSLLSNCSKVSAADHLQQASRANVPTAVDTGLAKWSRGEVGEQVISEIYVKLGNDFNVACAAFAKENIGME